MNKKRLAVILTVFFLVQSSSSPQGLHAELQALNPPTKIDLKDPQICLKKLSDVLCLALFIYKLDTGYGSANNVRYSKEALIDKYGSFLRNFSEVKFDLERIDIIKQRWTRYYPFSIEGKRFLIRVFFTEQYDRQLAVSVLFEGTARSGELTFQILPGVNEILKDCNIRPHRIYLEDPLAQSV